MTMMCRKCCGATPKILETYENMKRLIYVICPECEAKMDVKENKQ